MLFPAPPFGFDTAITGINTLFSDMSCRCGTAATVLCCSDIVTMFDTATISQLYSVPELFRDILFFSAIRSLQSDTLVAISLIAAISLVAVFGKLGICSVCLEEVNLSVL